MASGRALTEQTLGAWLVKASPVHLPVSRAPFGSITSRCVRPSYRTDLVRAGQPVLLWVSGNDRRHPPGIHAHGRTTGAVEHPDEEEPFMPVLLRQTSPFVPRGEVLAHPVLAGLEVLRMPAGSNPSYLDVEQYDALRHAFPQVEDL